MIIKNKLQIITSIFWICISSILMGIGVYAILSPQLSFNVGIKFTPDIICRVELAYDNILGNGSNGTIDENEYVTIFDNKNGSVNVDYITYVDGESLQFDANAIGLGKTINLRVTNYTSSHTILAWIESPLFTGTPVDEHTGLFYEPLIVRNGEDSSQIFKNISLPSTTSQNTTIKISMKKIVEVEHDLANTTVLINHSDSILQTDYNKYKYINADENFNATYTPDAGYNAPEKLKVFIKNSNGELSQLPESSYTYTVTDNVGHLEVSAEVVNGTNENVKIVVVSAKVYKISESFIGVTVEYNQTSYTSGFYFPDMGNLQATITANSNYKLPDAIEVERDGTKLNSGIDYTYTKTNDEIATLIIESTSVTKDIRIYIWGVSQSYTVFTYTSGTGPVYDNSNTSNRYVHYIEMGEYPQTYCGTELPKAESEYEITTDYYYNTQGTSSPSNPPIIKPALYEDKTTGQKFAKQGTNFYNVEPVRWIVIGVTDGVYGDEGEHVLFTTGNQAENESSNSGLWLYDEATNTFKYRTTTDGEWKNVTEVLVLSEYSLLRLKYIASGNASSPYYNHFSQSDINKVLNTNADSLYNTMFTDNQRTKIIPKTMEITSYYQNLNSKNYNNIEYNMFLLGATRNWNGSSWGAYGTDSYNVATYFIPINNNSNQSNLVSKDTAYSSGGTQNSPSSYSYHYWWLRSGTYFQYNNGAMLLSPVGKYDHGVAGICALRPAFVLNLE